MAEDTNILTAKVTLELDPTKAMASVDKAALKLQASLEKANKRVADKAARDIDANNRRIVGGIQRGAEKLGPIFERVFKFSVGLGATSIFAFIKSGTPEAKKLADTIDRVKVAWAGVGEKLATKVNVSGKTLQEWVGVFADRLESLDTKQIEKLVGYVKAIGVGFLALKGFTIAKPFIDIAVALKNAQSANSIAKALSQPQQAVAPVVPVSQNVSSLTSGALTVAAIAGKALSDIPKRPNFESSPMVSAEVLMDRYSKQGSPFGRLPIQSRMDYAWSKLSIDKSLPRIKENIKSPYSGLVVAGTIANEALNLASREKNSATEISTSIGKIISTVAGTVAGGPIGGAVTLMVADIMEQIAKGLGSATSNRSWYGFGPKIQGQNVEIGPLWDVQSKRSENILEEARKRQKIRDTRTESLTNTGIFALRKSSVYSDYLRDQNAMFPSGTMPSFKLSTTNVVANTDDKIKSLTLLEKSMLEVFDGFTDAEKTTNTEFKSALDAITSEKNYYISEQNRQVSTWREARQKEKAFNETIKEFDRQAIDAKTKLENTLTDINKDPNQFKPLQGSVSMGGGIESIPAIISQSLQEVRNKESEKINENFQKMIETNLAQLQYQMDLFNLSAEEKKFREETTKQDREDRKDIKTWIKEINESVTGGSSTVTRY